MQDLTPHPFHLHAGMPFALREAGFGLGVILIVLMGIITDFSVRVLVASGVKVNKPDYQVCLA
jgi:sodium-coupled neutral amino acid transporter 11